MRSMRASSAVKGFVSLLEKKPLSGQERYSLALHYAKEKRLKKCKLAGVLAEMFGGDREVGDDETVDTLVRKVTNLATRTRTRVDRHCTSAPPSLQKLPIDAAPCSSVLSSCGTSTEDGAEPSKPVPGERASAPLANDVKSAPEQPVSGMSSTPTAQDETVANNPPSGSNSSIRTTLVDTSTQASFFPTQHDFIALHEEFCLLRCAIEREREESRDRERRLTNQIKLLSATVDQLSGNLTEALSALAASGCRDSSATKPEGSKKSTSTSRKRRTGRVGRSLLARMRMPTPYPRVLRLSQQWISTILLPRSRLP